MVFSSPLWKFQAWYTKLGHILFLSHFLHLITYYRSVGIVRSLTQVTEFLIQIFNTV
jgi:hypothetical protein